MVKAGRGKVWLGPVGRGGVRCGGARIFNHKPLNNREMRREKKDYGKHESEVGW